MYCLSRASAASAADVFAVTTVSGAASRGVYHATAPDDCGRPTRTDTATSTRAGGVMALDANGQILASVVVLVVRLVLDYGTHSNRYIIVRQTMTD